MGKIYKMKHLSLCSINYAYPKGGNMNGVGNTHLVGEFNFYGDPEGAKIVLDEYTPTVINVLFTCSQNNKFSVLQQ